MRYLVVILFMASYLVGMAQDQPKDTVEVYKKRVLETVEVDFLTSYYGQNGRNAAVTGGIGTEELTDMTGAIVISIPLNDDDILTIDGGVSAYTSASSSNINPFDKGNPDPFVASSGASGSDLWSNGTIGYSHSSDDRNKIWTGNLSFSTEYDYYSIGGGGSFTKLFNEKNTEFSVKGNIFIDKWNAIYPSELKPFAPGREGLSNSLFTENAVQGNGKYNPVFSEFSNEGRNSYSVGFGFAQILSKSIQGSLVLDVVLQKGLLSTPFQRVYFSDVDDFFIDNFQLADAIEQMPNTRIKVALGGRLNFCLNENFVLRTFYRYYEDDWSVKSHTASIEMPIKLSDRFTIYPGYRFYIQSKAEYFAPYEEHISTNKYYTSDYDLSGFNANQYNIGISYKDIFTKMHIWKFGLKSIDLKFSHYNRSSSLNASIITAGCKFVLD